MVMRYLVFGSGGREHALAWRLMADGSASAVYVAPGNGGIEPRFCVPLAPDDFSGIESFCVDKKIDMVIVGPEAPLVAGLADFLDKKKIPVFGPSAGAARLEGSKLFAKRIMEKYNIPTARHEDFIGPDALLKYLESRHAFPVVIKLDGLAAGKGVALPESLEEARTFVHENVREDTRVFVEEFFDGEEASVLGVSDGNAVYPLIAAQDHKRIYDGDRGPNTGGMGAYAPAPVVTDRHLATIHRDILTPTIEGMKKEGSPFKGILYAGLMIKGDSIKVLEYNVRFGDPEAQVILPLIDGRLGTIIEHAVSGSLRAEDFSFKSLHAMTVVMVSEGYPGAYKKDIPITGLDNPLKDILVFHAGTRRKDNTLLTNGGRVLNVTALGTTLQAAKDLIYSKIDAITFSGAFYRKDIGHRALS